MELSELKKEDLESHDAVDCMKEIKNKNRSSKEDGLKVVCFKCGDFSHVANQCPMNVNVGQKRPFSLSLNGENRKLWLNQGH